jgi:hypothetical protein
LLGGQRGTNKSTYDDIIYLTQEDYADSIEVIMKKVGKWRIELTPEGKPARKPGTQSHRSKVSRRTLFSGEL